MPIAKRRDNVSDIVDKAVKRRNRVNIRKRRLSSAHVATSFDSEVVKLREQYKTKSKYTSEDFSRSKELLEEEESSDLGAGDENPSSPAGTHEGQGRQIPDSLLRLLVMLSVVSTHIYIVVEHAYWRGTRLVFICLAIYALACEVSLLEGEQWIVFFDVANIMINSFFLFDGIMKLWSFFGYLRIEEKFSAKSTYYASVRRCGIIDATIASLCFYFGSSPTGNWLKLVRVSFIALFGVQQLASLDVLMSGIGFGLHSVAYTWLLLVLVFVVYGAAGVTFYAENDPYHFGTIAISMWTFFQISTLDDWIDVMLLNQYGCDVYPAQYYPGTQRLDIHAYGHFYLPVCTNPSKQKIISIVIFLTFIVIVAFVLMSLTIAAVTAGINDRLDNLQKEELREELSGLNNQYTREGGLSMDTSRKLDISKSMSNILRTDSARDALDIHLTADPALLRLMLFQVLNVKRKLESPSESKRLERAGTFIKPKKPSLKVKEEIMRQLSSEATGAESQPPRTNQTNLDSSITKIVEVDERSLSKPSLNTDPSVAGLVSSGSFVKQLIEHVSTLREDLSIQQVSLTCRNLSNHKTYNVIINLFIFFGALFELNSLQEKGKDVLSKSLDEPINIMLQIVFTFDITVKVVAAFPQYSNFWKKKWNRFDLITVGLLWIVLIINLKGLPGRVLELLRVLRIFRILKLISKIQELNVIMLSIGSSLRALSYVVALMFIFFFLFAVAGIYLFEQNDPFHFEGLVRAFTTLFQVATLDNWSDVARVNMLGCNNTEYEYDPPCTNPKALGWIAAWYFIIFIILGVMVLLSLFVGVIITSMELLKEGLKEEANVLAKVKEIQKQYNISDSSIEHLLEIFEIIDVGSNGKLTLDELKPVLEVVSVTPVQQFEMFVKVDSDRSGQIDFSEFCELIQLIGQIYIENEEKRGAKIIRRTRTYKRLDKRNVKRNIVKGNSEKNFMDNNSEATSDAGKIRLPRGGSSGSLVVGGEWSDKDNKSYEEVNQYQDDDLDKPVEHDVKSKQKPEEHKRTTGGIWSMFNVLSPRQQQSDAHQNSRQAAPSHNGNISGSLSPFPSAINVFNGQAHHQTFCPGVDHDSSSRRSSFSNDEDNEPHNLKLKSTASAKLNLLAGNTRPKSGTSRLKEKDSTAVVLAPLANNSDAHSRREELNHMSLAEMSMHSLRNLADYSLLRNDAAVKNVQVNKSRAQTASSVPDTLRGHTYSDPNRPSVSCGDMEVVETSSRKDYSINLSKPLPEFESNNSPSKMFSEVGSGDVWEVDENTALTKT